MTGIGTGTGTGTGTGGGRARSGARTVVRMRRCKSGGDGGAVLSLKNPAEGQQ